MLLDFLLLILFALMQGLLGSCIVIDAVNHGHAISPSLWANI